MTELEKILDRIVSDVARVRVIMGSQMPAGKRPRDRERMGQAVSPLTVRTSYTVKEATTEKARIEQAYLLGSLTYDQKRGMKMLVTKRTVGWTPDKRAA